MKKFLVLFLLGTVLRTTVCNCGAGKHIIRSGGLSANEKQAILDVHNRFRQSVALGQVSNQPPAINMMEMVWDDELSEIAQRWSDQCTTHHDQNTQRDVLRFPVGQNLAATWTTRPPSEPVDSEPDFIKQINVWFDEVRIYSFKPYNGKHGIGHYTQLVWGETSHIGCGFTFYYDPSRGYTKLYVCNYGTGGNVVGSTPYVKGSPSCSSYGLSDSRKYTGLCLARFTSPLSYQTEDSNSYISNVIPHSSDTNYQYQYSNQYSNNKIFNQFSNQYEYQYQQPSTYYQTYPANTENPIISLFKSASNYFTKPKPQKI